MEIKTNILNTLKYSFIFNFPLSVLEIHKYLISKEKIEIKEIENFLMELYKEKKVVKKENIYSLLGAKNIWFTSKVKSEKSFEKILQKTKKDLFLLKLFPFIKFIGLTGSVSAKNIKANSDIDLFTITSKNTVWFTRFFVVLYLKIIRKYKKVYCANIYINEKDLEWESKNIYIANEIARLYPIINKQKTYEKFIYKNKWIFEYLKNLEDYLPKLEKEKKGFGNFFGKLFFSIEFIFYIFQFRYMKNKITSEKVSLGRILFLKNDYSEFVLKSFTKYS